MRAELARLLDLHAGFDTEGPRLVGTGDDGGACHAVGDAHRLAAQLGEIALLNRRKEAVLVGEGNAAGPYTVHPYSIAENATCVFNQY